MKGSGEAVRIPASLFPGWCSFDGNDGNCHAVDPYPSPCRGCSTCGTASPAAGFGYPAPRLISPETQVTSAGQSAVPFPRPPLPVGECKLGFRGHWSLSGTSGFLLFTSRMVLITSGPQELLVSFSLCRRAGQCWGMDGTLRPGCTVRTLGLDQASSPGSFAELEWHPTQPPHWERQATPHCWWYRISRNVCCPWSLTSVLYRWELWIRIKNPILCLAS